MPAFSGQLGSARQGWYDVSDTQKHALGTKVVSSDGFTYQYAKAGATTLNVADTLQAPARQANNVNLAPVDANLVVIGATSITVVTGTTEPVAALAAVGGRLTVSNGAGFGVSLLIASHSVGVGGDNVTFTFAKSDLVPFNANSSTRFDLCLNDFNGVSQASNASFTAPVVAVAISPITNGQFGWVATGGDVNINTAGTPGVGVPVVRATAGLSGQVEVANSTNTFTQQTIGTMKNVGVAGKAKLVTLSLGR